MWQLNEDGTLKLGANGEAVETYDNSDLYSLSRVWTGFENRAERGNVFEAGFDRVPLPNAHG